MVRLDVEHYDGNGAYVRTASAWTAIRTDGNVQDSTSSTRCTNALVGFLTSANVTKIVSRES